jgi:hypothetical protein
MGDCYHPVPIMITIPDTIDKMKKWIAKLIDLPLSWMEHLGSKIHVYAWNKRWKNRKDGYGYRR